MQKIFDVNKDGKVDFEDFMKIMVEVATEVLKDGKINTSDIFTVITKTIEILTRKEQVVE